MKHKIDLEAVTGMTREQLEAEKQDLVFCCSILETLNKAELTHVINFLRKLKTIKAEQ